MATTIDKHIVNAFAAAVTAAGLTPTVDKMTSDKSAPQFKVRAFDGVQIAGEIVLTLNHAREWIDNEIIVRAKINGEQTYTEPLYRGSTGVSGVLEHWEAALS